MRIIPASLSFLLSLSLCISCTNEPSLSLDEVGGVCFQYHTPITAITCNGDNLLVATDHGTIATFDINNGLFTEIASLNCGTIYHMEVIDDYLFYTVQDGGIRRLDLKNHKDSDVVLSLGGVKGTHYSAYELLVDQEKHSIYGATSNGVYKWDMTNLEEMGEAIIKDKTNGPNRFYSITREGNSDIVVGGLPGIFRITDDRTVPIARDSVLALHHGFKVSKTGVVSIKGYNEESVLATFKRVPRNFVVSIRENPKDTAIYAISDRTVECIDFSTHVKTTINLPEKHLSRARNKSIRAVGVIHGSFLYAAPGGSNLYRIPLTITRSQEVISLCMSKESTVYALSEANDLFSIEKDNNKKKGRFKSPKYIRSFKPGAQVRLLGTNERGQLIAQIDSSIILLDGRKKPELLHTPHAGGLSSWITYNLLDGNVLYQARTDSIRKYDFTESSNPSPFPFRHKKDDGLHSQPDYYPTIMAKMDNRIVFGTLHDGVYAVDAARKDYRFDLLAPLSKQRVEDIKTVGMTAFVLTSDSLYRFTFDQVQCRDSAKWNKSTLGKNLLDREETSLGQTLIHCNKLVAISPTDLFFYSDYYDFARGVHRFNNREIRHHVSYWEEKESYGESDIINDALYFGSDSLLVLGGSMGLRYTNFTDVNESIPFVKPSSFSRLRARVYPFFWLIALLTIIGVCVLGWLGSTTVAKWLLNKKQTKQYLEMRSRIDALEKREPATLTREECQLAMAELNEIENKYKTHLHDPERHLSAFKRHLEDRISYLEMECRLNNLEKKQPQTIDDYHEAIEDAKAIEHDYKTHFYDLQQRLSTAVRHLVEGQKDLEEQQKKKLFVELSTDFRKWSTQSFSSGYISALVDEIILLSEGEPDILTRKIERFKKEMDKLRVLDNIGVVIHSVEKQIIYHTPFPTKTDFKKWRDREYQEYIRMVATFFESFVDEEKANSEWGLIFRELKDISSYKQTFLFFPLCVDDEVGTKFLSESDTFKSRKSNWKKGNDKKDRVHILKNVIHPEYQGIISIIARAGLRRIMKEENKG